MTIQVVGLQIGPYQNGESYTDRMERLSALFDQALEGEQKSDLLVFPELMASPYFCTTKNPAFFEMAEPLDGPTYVHFSKKAKEANVHVIVTLFEKIEDHHGTSFYNTAMVISNTGERKGVYRKTHIPHISLPTLTTDESFYFKRGEDYPVFDILGFKVGILICFDRSFPEAARALAVQGAELIVIPTAASGEERKEAWLAECQARARENGVFVLGVNRGGYEKVDHTNGLNLAYFGLTCAFDPGGKMLGKPLDSEPWQTFQMEVERTLLLEYREKLNVFDHLQVDLYHAAGQEIQIIKSYSIEKEQEPLFGPKGVIAGA